jgi:hypothetical protein
MRPSYSDAMSTRYKTSNFREPTVCGNAPDLIFVSWGDLHDTKTDEHYDYGCVKVSYKWSTGDKGTKTFTGETAHHDAFRWLNDQVHKTDHLDFPYAIHASKALGC